MKILKYIFFLLTFLLSFGLLLAFTKGHVSNSVAFQSGYDVKVGGPFESSNSSSRYALTEAIAKYKTFIFNKEEAKFSLPDLVESKGNFFSIFTPGISFIGVPFYLFGNLFGLPQLFTYFSVIIFSVLNLFLVARLAKKLGAGLYSGILSGFIFLFATNALPYSLTFTQHQISVSFILLSILNALGKRTIINNILFGIWVGLSLLMDIPNVIMLAPIIFYVFLNHFNIRKVNSKININFRFISLFLLIGIIPLIVLFGLYNFGTSGSYTKIGQNIGRSENLKIKPVNLNNQLNLQVNAPEIKNYLINVPFQTRNQVNGFYILLISNERSWIFYSPVILLGILGLFLAFKKQKTILAAKLASSILLFNIIIYSMFGDPWGGWAFGPRYLIPGAAILAAGVGPVLLKWKKNPIFFLVFFVLFSYSLSVNTLGGLTTNAIPPKGEAEKLQHEIPYTYEYNLQFINSNKSENLIYSSFLNKYISLRNFWYLSILLILTVGMIGYLFLLKEKGEENA